MPDKLMCKYMYTCKLTRKNIDKQNVNDNLLDFFYRSNKINFKICET